MVPSPDPGFSLDDKWTTERGRVLMSGTQALARILLAQSSLDRRRGLATAGYVTGYRGSPLGNVDTTLWSIAARLKDANIVFQPGLNEDIAVTAIRGTQQIEAVPGARYDGVFAAWYSKGPGVDRSGDALKHGNYAGTHRHGGVLIFYGDDHAGKSSTVAHQSEQALAANLIPSLYPANVQELLDYGLLGLALSRYSGSWVAIKCVSDVAEQTATVNMNLQDFSTIEPEAGAPLPLGLHVHQGAFNPLREEQIVIEHRLPRVHAFIRANGIDRTVIRAARPALGLISAGKSYGDVRSALALLGLDDARAGALGISLYKVGCIWPLEPERIAEFAQGHDTLLVVEEKKSFIEAQLAAVLINQAQRPSVVGKVDERGAPLLSATQPLTPAQIARVIVGRLEALGLSSEELRARGGALQAQGAPAVDVKRSPYFCSGCPHNRSTQIPAGSISMTGIGCHTMANFVRPKEALLPTQMGGEGGNWIGLAPFTRTEHIFQNMGDGTYYHSGLMAIRAAVAAGVNITYKILYNDAVAMTGGQPIDGPISVATIARQVLNEGVVAVHLLSDDPKRHRDDDELPGVVKVGHRDTLDEVQRTLRTTAGCSVLIYEQTCAAEKRRRRKRGSYPNPAKRLFIAKSVCEACGDCSVQSTCVSLVPVETAFGRKRAIDQSSCNKDYSCVNGFCPSFITVYGAEPRKRNGVALEESLFNDLPLPPRAPLGQDGFNLLVAGIGGTGVVTVGAVLGTAAHIDGFSASLFDVTGLSQKNGAVMSHVRIAHTPTIDGAQRLSAGEADVLLAFDLVAALSSESLLALRAGRTQAIANTDVAPTAAFQFERDFATDPEMLRVRLCETLGAASVMAVDASTLALAILGDTIGANLFMLGVAAQRGLLPVTLSAIEAAVTLNGVAVAFNLRALRLGRLFAVDPERVVALGAADESGISPLPTTLDEVIDHRASHLTDYQGPALALRYRQLVARVREVEARICPGSEALTLAVARNYAKLLAYKDEYEVARLLTSAGLHEEIRRSFEDGGRVAFNMAPPLLGGSPVNGRPRKREFGPWIIGVLGVLKRLRGLRGTPLDPFGLSAERRAERALITEYEALTARLLQSLSPAKLTQAVALLGLADAVRGFGPVKQAAIDAYRASIKTGEAAYRSAPVPAPQPVEEHVRRLDSSYTRRYNNLLILFKDLPPL